MAATNAIQEEAATNGGVEVVKKLNANFGALKFADSKKRQRGAYHQDQAAQANELHSTTQNQDDEMEVSMQSTN